MTMKWCGTGCVPTWTPCRISRWLAKLRSGEEAIDLVSELIPDVVLMDLIMPGMDGVETTRQIKKISPRTQVVVLTSYHEDAHIFPALKAGAISVYSQRYENGETGRCPAPRRPG